MSRNDSVLRRRSPRGTVGRDPPGARFHQRFTRDPRTGHRRRRRRLSGANKRECSIGPPTQRVNRVRSHHRRIMYDRLMLLRYFSRPRLPPVLCHAQPGIINTVAGTGVAGSSGDGGPGKNAQLNTPNGVAVDANAHVYIADYANSRIRKLLTTDFMQTIAGCGTTTSLHRPIRRPAGRRHSDLQSVGRGGGRRREISISPIAG